MNQVIWDMTIVYALLVIGALASLFNAVLQYKWYRKTHGMTDKEEKE